MSAHDQDRRTLLAGSACVLGTWLFGALIFYRAQWTSGFNNLMGNVGDSTLAAYLNEEWFRVFHGQAPWLSPPIFDPVKGVLGWTDTFLIYQVFYAPLRLVGLDPFVALQVTVILLSLVGFASFYALVRLLFATPRYLALALALVATFSNALYTHVREYQFAGVYVVPSVVVLGVLAWRAAGEGRRRTAVVLGGCSGLLAALLLYSTYYMAYFSLLALGILLVVSSVGGGRRFLGWASTGVRRRRATIAAVLGGFCAGLVPFAVTYLPVPGKSANRAYASIIAAAPTPSDLMNVTQSNAVWGHVLRAITPALVSPGPQAVAQGSATFAVTYAVTPLLLALAIGGGVLCLFWWLKGLASNPPVACAATALAVTTLIVLLLPVHLGNLSLWAITYHLPGASALRSIGRIGIVAGLLAALTVAAAGAEATTHVRGLRRAGWRVATAGLALVMVVEQFNTADVSHIDNRAQIGLLDGVTRPPAECHSFYVLDPVEVDYWWGDNVDAMLISQKVSLPTINGYSGLFPSGWQLEITSGPRYLVRVRAWAAEHGLEKGLCQLDVSTNRWKPMSTDEVLAAASAPSPKWTFSPRLSPRNE